MRQHMPGRHQVQSGIAFQESSRDVLRQGRIEIHHTGLTQFEDDVRKHRFAHGRRLKERVVVDLHVRAGIPDSEGATPLQTGILDHGD